MKSLAGWLWLPHLLAKGRRALEEERQGYDRMAGNGSAWAPAFSGGSTTGC